MEFKIMNSKGDAAIDYDNEIAEVKFNELAKDLIPYERREGRLIKLDDFRPESERVFWFPKLSGG